MCELLGLLRKPWSPGPDSLKRPVSASRVSIEDRRLSSSPIIIRMSTTASWLPKRLTTGCWRRGSRPASAAGKSAKTQGIRVDNWLSLRSGPAQRH